MNAHFFRLLPLAAYFGVVCVVFGAALLPPHDMLIFGDDLHLSYYFFRKYFTDTLLTGSFPWWNPYLFSGTPFAAHPQTLLPFYPLHWVFIFLPLNISFSWYFAFHILLAMVGMYWCCRLFMGRMAAWVSGFSFGLSGFFMARVWAGHVDMVAAAAYLPIVFGLFWIALHDGRGKSLVFAAGALALQLFVGYQTIALFTLEAIGMAVIFVSIGQRSWKPLIRAVLAIVLGIGLAAVAFIPQQEFVSRSIRTYPFPYEWASAQAFTLENLKTLVAPFAFGDQRNYHGPWPNLAEYAMYIGILPLGLSLVSFFGLLFYKKRRAVILLFASLCIFSLWISFAGNAPIDLLKIFWTYIPVYHSLRIPVRHLILFVFGASMLAGIALDALKQKTLVVGIIILTLIDLLPFANHFIELRKIPEERHDPKLITLLRSDSELYRVLPNYGVWLEPRSSLDFDSAMTYKIFSTTGYDPSILRNYYEFIDAAGGHKTSSFLEHNVQVPYLDLNSSIIDFLNIKYIFVPNWLDPLGGVSSQRYQLIIDNPDRGYRLYQNKTPMPRFFFVSKFKVYPDRKSIYHDIVAGNVDLSKVVLGLEGAKRPSASDCPVSPFGSVLVRQYTANRIYLSVETPCDAVLSTSEVYYPGWQASIDGKNVEAVEGNLAFRTILVPKGNHDIVIWYNPNIFLWGGFVSFIFIVISGFLMLLKKNFV